MDALEEKKWFVYVKDHHTGPFTLAEIQGQIHAGAISPATYVWAEGMADWAQMTSVEAFAGVLNPGASAFAEAEPASKLTLAHSASPAEYADHADYGDHGSHGGHAQGEAEPQAFALHEAEAEPQAFALHEAIAEPIQLFSEERGNQAYAEPTLESTGHSEVAEPSFAPLHESEHASGGETSPETSPETEPAANPRGPRRTGLWIALFLLILLAGGSAAYMKGFLNPLLDSPAIHGAVEATTTRMRPTLLKLAQKYPALQKWVSPIPALTDVSPDEYAELQKAAMTDETAAGGPGYALALSREDLTKPAFYLATGAAPANGAEPVDYDIYLEGVADSLLMQTSFFTVASISVKQHLGKGVPVLGPDHSPIVRGQYRVSVTAHAEGAAAGGAPAVDALPKDAKVLASRTYFLGGPNDAMYLSRLKEFHEHLQTKATTEMQELKQFAMTLQSQLADTMAQFASASGGRLTAAKKLKWNEFHGRWSKLSENFAQNYPRWSAPGALNEYFHGALYIQTAETARAIEKLHQAQTDFVTGKAGQNVNDIQLGTLTSLAESTLAALKSRIEKTAALPASPGGLPQKEPAIP